MAAASTNKKQNSRNTIETPYKCQICQDSANEHQHFGAKHACFSCKAFFRRVIRSETKLPFCQKNNECQINSSTRTECPSCRYQKCLSSGMSPKWVMTKKDLEEKKRLSRLKSLLNPTRAEKKSFRSEYEIKTSLERKKTKPKCDIKLLAYQAKDLYRDLVNVEFASFKGLFVDGHLNDWNEKHSKGFCQISKVFEKLTVQFASKNVLFQQLSSHDQALLLESNRNLFHQFILAQYFSASSGFEQLYWILGPKVSKLCKFFLFKLLHS